MRRSCVPTGFAPSPDSAFRTRCASISSRRARSSSLPGSASATSSIFQAPASPRPSSRPISRGCCARCTIHTQERAPPQRGAAPPGAPVPRDARWLDTLIDPAPLPAWLTPADLAIFSDAFTRSGLSGPLNWYRAIDRTWELTAPWRNAPVMVPALFMRCGRSRAVILPPGGRGSAADRAAADEERAGAGLRPLDPAGAAGRGERGASGVLGAAVAPTQHARPA